MSDKNFIYHDNDFTEDAIDEYDPLSSGEISYSRIAPLDITLVAQNEYGQAAM